MRTVLMMIGLALFALDLHGRTYGAVAARRTRSILLQQGTGRHTVKKVSRQGQRRAHRGHYSLRKDLTHAFSGHGIGWGARAAL